MKIYLIRHGQKESSLKTYLSNKISLTDLGKKQAVAFAEFAKNLKIQKMYVSPYLRTKETAKEIEKVLNLKAIKTDKIKEMHLSNYINFMIENLLDKSEKNFEKELISNLKTLAEEDKNILLVTHSGYIRMLKAILTKTNRNVLRKFKLLFSPMHNLSLTAIEMKNGRLNIVDFDNVEYLHDDLKNRFPY